jgi:hypothetical protein
MSSRNSVENPVHDIPIEDRVRRCYESAIETGLGEKAAIDAALVLWRTARPAEAMGPSRQAVAQIVARSRVEKRAGRPIDDVLKDRHRVGD